MEQNLKYIFENKDFIVLEKPGNIATHPSPGDTGLDLVSILKKKYLKIFPVMRLDKGTSGLIIFGLNAEFVHKVNFINKEYLAIVFGLTQEQGVIEQDLTKKKFGSKTKIIQKALSKYLRLENTGNFSLLRIAIETGRFHQIRKHLRFIGHPALGDFRHGYNDKNIELQKKIDTILRLCLHCCCLEFYYNDQKYKYELPLSSDLQNIWFRIRSL